MATICEMLENNARKYPDDIALIELRPSKNYRKAINWKEFNENSTTVAIALIKWGIQRYDKVIHWMRNSIPWLETYFGIIKTGAWAVPLNYRFTADDFRYCAGIAEAKAMILKTNLASLLDR
jgi:acyl-CoA synthetase (AMP-forming)/AMP-acid ligase II